MDNRISSADDPLVDKIYEITTNPHQWLGMLGELARHLEQWDPLWDTDNRATSATNPMNSHSLDSAPAILRHLERATTIIGSLTRLDERAAAGDTMLNQLPLCVFVVEGSGKIRMSNQRARALLGTRNYLIRAGDRVQPANTAFRSEFEELLAPFCAPRCIQNAEIPSAELIELPGSSEHPPLPMVISRSALDDTSDQSCLALLLLPPADLNINTMANILISSYGLTVAESRVALGLLDGQSLQGIAESRRVSINTVKSQLRGCLAKTQCDTQQALVRKVLLCCSLVPTDNPSKPIPIAVASDRLRIDQFVQAGNRTIAYREYGVLGGRAIIFCPNVMGSRLQRPPDHLTREAGVHLVVLDRPGLGRSDPYTDFRVVDWPDDALAVADHLELNNIEVVGLAHGGAFACALARAAPDRVTNLALLGCDTPGASIESTRGLLPVHRLMYHLAWRLPKMHRLVMSFLLRGVRAHPEQYIDEVMNDLGAGDQDALKNHGAAANLIESVLEGSQQGADVIAHETQLAVIKGWNVELPAITCPVLIWHGEQDSVVPATRAPELAKEFPNAYARVVPNRGHLGVYQEWGQILKLMQLQRGELPIAS